MNLYGMFKFVSALRPHDIRVGIQVDPCQCSDMGIIFCVSGKNSQAFKFKVFPFPKSIVSTLKLFPPRPAIMVFSGYYYRDRDQLEVTSESSLSLPLC